MKGIILHGGHGTRLRPLTHTGPKQLLPIANKPMSQYALEDLRDSGITDIALIVGGNYHEKVKEYYGDGKQFGVSLTYIYQDKPKGIAHAIGLCKEFVSNSNFIVYLGDNVLRKGISSFIGKFNSDNSDAMILLCEVKNPEVFGIADVDFSLHKIKKIVEKPKNPTSNLAVIGVYFLTPSIFKIIENLKPSWRGELEITEALQLLMNNNYSIEFDLVTGWWKDTGTPEDILHANQLILETLNNNPPDEYNTIDNNIFVGKNSIVDKDAILKGPIIIGKNCNINSKTILGPNVSIGNNSIIKNCKISNSIIMDNCQISSEINILNSIVAHGSEISHSLMPKKYQFLLGERSKILL